MGDSTFDKALTFSMREEVGAFFNPNDPVVQLGLCETATHKKQTGYSCTVGDNGGETKFGIAKNANPSVNIKTLTYSQAEEIYKTKYWGAMKLDKISSVKIATILLDTAINCGVGFASKMLQRVLNLSADGIIGNVTIASCNAANENILVQKLLQARRERYATVS